MKDPRVETSRQLEEFMKTITVPNELIWGTWHNKICCLFQEWCEEKLSGGSTSDDKYGND